MKKSAEMNATLELHDSGQWVLKLRSNSAQDAIVADAMMNGFSFGRDHSHVLVLALAYREYTDGEVMLSFNVDEGPDIVGRQSELEALRNWKPGRKR